MRAQIADGLHEIIVLGAGPRDAGGVGFLEGVVADQMGRHLAGQADHGDGIHQRVGETGHGIGGARTRGHQHDADLAGRARIALGGMDGGLLVADQDVAQPVLLEQRVVDRQDRAARIAEDDLDFLVDQGFHQQIGAGRGGLLGLHDGVSFKTNAPQNRVCGGAENIGGVRKGQPKSARNVKFQTPELVNNFSAGPETGLACGSNTRSGVIW